MPKLVLNAGTPQAQEFHLKPGKNYFGRGFANDFKLEDASVSGSHAMFTMNGPTVTVTDLGSTNGTRINQLPATGNPLQTGQVVRLGGVELLFVADGTPGLAAPGIAPPLTAAEKIATEFFIREPSHIGVASAAPSPPPPPAAAPAPVPVAALKIPAVTPPPAAPIIAASSPIATASAPAPVAPPPPVPILIPSAPPPGPALRIPTATPSAPPPSAPATVAPSPQLIYAPAPPPPPPTFAAAAAEAPPVSGGNRLTLAGSPAPAPATITIAPAAARPNDRRGSASPVHRRHRSTCGYGCVQVSSEHLGPMALPEVHPALLLPVRHYPPDARRHGSFLPDLRNAMRAGETESRREEEGKATGRVF